MVAGFAIIGWLIFQVYQPIQQREETPRLKEFQFTQIHMGMPVNLTVWAESRPLAESACKVAFRRIGELENVFSDYIEGSDVDRVNFAKVGQKVSVAPSFGLLVGSSQMINKISQGAFDPTFGDLIMLWRSARKTKQLPSQDAIDLVLRDSGLGNVELIRVTDDSGNDELFAIKNSDLSFDFGGIAKGYIGDRAISSLKEQGIDIACYEAGGDIVCSNPPPGTTGWPIDVPGQPELKVSNCGVAVSGDTVQFVVIDNVRYSHVVDVRTGRAITKRTMAVVIAPTGTLSDALATAGCVLESDEFQTMIDSIEGARGWQLDAALLEVDESR